MAPPVEEYVPAAQSLHSTAPAESLYFPAPHSAHTPPAGPEEPALQVQFVTIELPADEVEKYLVGQSMQMDDPAEFVYFPASHGMHVPPSGPE